MQVAAKCIPCYLDQVIRALDQVQVPPKEQVDIIHQVMSTVQGLDQSRSPAENSSLVMHRVVELLGGRDPFADAKATSNAKAQALLPKLEADVKSAKDPLFQALQFAVAGNVVDLGLYADYDLAGAVREVIEKGFALNHYQQLQKVLEGAKQVLIIGDNSGEIVFDTLLVKQLQAMGKEVTYAVKGAFVINDSTMADAEAIGLTRLTKVITNGNNFLGTIDEHCSEEFKDTFRQADLVLSKGQANYESLEGTTMAGTKTFFLLKAKCTLVADNLGSQFGDMVLVQNQPKE